MIIAISSVSKILKKVWLILAMLIIFAAISSSVFRALTPWAKQYKSEVESHLSTIVGQPVSIGSMETGWYWFQPVLKLKQVKIHEAKGKTLGISHLLIGINLFKSLWQWHLQPGVLYIDDIHLVLRQKQDHWQVEGLSTAAIDEKQLNQERIKTILMWLSNQEKLVIRHLYAHLYLENGKLIPISGFNLSIINHSGRYSIKGGAELLQRSNSSFQLIADLYFNPNHLEHTKGQIYFSAKGILPTQWQTLFPEVSKPIEGGKIDIGLWIDLEKGTISSLQSQFNIKDLRWHRDNTKSQFIDAFSANLLWKPSDIGWQLQADNIRLRIAAQDWPQNKLLVQYNKNDQSYRLFVKTIVLETLFANARLNPQGVLTDTQVLIKESPTKTPIAFWGKHWEISYLLTRFKALGWKEQNKIPQISNLSGVLHWQPEEGRLELDSEKASISMKGYPKQEVDLLNAAIEWKELSDGLRLSLERFVLSQQHLVLTSEGVFSAVSKNSLGHISLNADFAAQNLEKWIAYLPKQYLKPGLLLWLNNDLKHIAKASGKIQIHGSAQDFPFDTPGSGDFSLVAHVSGGEVLIGHHWQPLKDLEGYINLNHRNLDIHLTHGNMGGLPIEQVNLKIDDIGKDKETLLVRGLSQLPAQQALEFIKGSALKTNFQTLSNVKGNGLLGLSLNLEIPLYPEKDEVLVEGDLEFNQNGFLLKQKLTALSLEEVSGKLHFTEKGLSQSHLTATLFGNPWTIALQTLEGKKPYTSLILKGLCTVDSLQQSLNFALSPLFKGSFYIDAELKLAKNSKASNKLTLSSDLSGLKINLPAPLGKAFEVKKPLALSLAFKDQSLHLKGDYDNLLSADLLFNKFILDAGQIGLGGAKAIAQPEPGLSIIGKLDDFAFKAWGPYVALIFSEDNQFDFLGPINFIDVSLGKLHFLKQQWDDVTLKAKRLSNVDWSFSINQTNLSGDFNYYLKTNTLSGHIKHLHLKSPLKEAQASFNIQPEAIPKLNLRIDNLSQGKLKIGDVTLKSHSAKHLWILDYCRIDSPVYRIMMKGRWEQKETINNSYLEVQGESRDLGKTLELWSITPVIKAKKAELEFKGGWNSSFFDFSLGRLYGQLKLELKNGVITHLSKETEEKLGLGKLLSILSLQTIPRRLQLDFSDLANEGFSFDLFRGTFTIKKGIMSTVDSYLDGPVAYASMKGELDLVRHLYDLHLGISPHITASLPIVATIAGGPIAGVATWVASKIISQGMHKISAYTYKVSGPWSAPVVQQVNMVRKSED